MRELASESCRNLGYLPYWGEAIEPGHQGVMEGSGNGQRRGWPRYDIAIVGLGEHTTLDDGLGQLLNEQRDAVSAIDDLFSNLFGQRLASGHLRDHLSALPQRQPVETE
jgi:hypothetical protein